MTTITEDFYDSNTDWIELKVYPAEDIEQPYEILIEGNLRMFTEQDFNAFIRQLNWMKRARKVKI